TDLAVLSVEVEWRRIKGALLDLERQGRVCVDRLEPATVASLQARLSASDYHILHFIGHGDFDPDSGSSFLVLEDERRLGQVLYTEDLRTLIRDERGQLQLVVLNACHGAQTARGDPFAGLA